MGIFAFASFNDGIKALNYLYFGLSVTIEQSPLQLYFHCFTIPYNILRHQFSGGLHNLM